MELLFFAVAFFSEIVGTVVGFGSSTLLLPLSLFFFDFKTTLVLVALFHTFGNLSRIGFFKAGLDKNMLIKFGLPSMTFTLIGAVLVSVLSQQMLKGVLGIFLICYSLMVFWQENFQVKPTLINTLLGGGSVSYTHLTLPTTPYV